MILSPALVSLLKNGNEFRGTASPYLGSIIYDDKIGAGSTLSLELLRTGLTPPFVRGDKILARWSNAESPLDELNTGTFIVDRLDSHFGGATTQAIGCLAYDFGLGFRGRFPVAYQGSTLRAIVGTQATFPTPDLTWNSSIILNEVAGAATTETGTDYRESGASRLELLRDLARKYAYVFNIKGGVLTFLPFESMTALPSVATIISDDVQTADFSDNRSEMARYAYTDYTGAGGSYHITESAAASPSIDVIDVRAEGWYVNSTVAARRAYGALREANNEWLTARITVVGSAVYGAGKNVTLANFYDWGGLWNITRARHTLDNRGWITDLELREVPL